MVHHDSGYIKKTDHNIQTNPKAAAAIESKKEHHINKSDHNIETDPGKYTGKPKLKGIRTYNIDLMDSTEDTFNVSMKKFASKLRNEKGGGTKEYKYKTNFGATAPLKKQTKMNGTTSEKVKTVYVPKLKYK